jgi:lipopolysaccharide transport system ATP-binding protein
MLNNNCLINVEGLYKKFCTDMKSNIYYGLTDLFKSITGRPLKTDTLKKNEFWALNNINLKLFKGECLGIIGGNGSGKSTLLRLLSNIYPPDAGRISITGKIGALISLGAGFHPHLTGRENIFLNGAMLGLKKHEIETEFQNIVDFAETENFLDAPVATYSSGMSVRLGFSIALYSRPDIMLIDEILSVGDQAFKHRCLQKLKSMKNNSSKNKVQALIMVSHDLKQIENICNRVIIMDHGKIIAQGKPDDMIKKYKKEATKKASQKGSL